MKDSVGTAKVTRSLSHGRRHVVAAGMVLAALLVLAPNARASSTSFFTGLSASMTTARDGAVAAPLPDGRVLIAGGYNGSSELSSAEVFDPSSGAFTALSGRMSTARGDAVAAPLPDGRVLIAGGCTNATGRLCDLSSAELFDPSINAFVPLAHSMTQTRVGAIAAPLPDGRVLVAGGKSIDGGPASSAEVFDPATGTFTGAGAFTPIGSMTTPREYAVAAPLPDGQVLIAGGYGNSGPLSSVELFNPSRGSFTAVGSMTTPRENAVAAPLPDGRVLIAGGYNVPSGYLSSAEVFDPSSGTFTALSAPMTTARGYAVAAPLPDGRLLITGGYNLAGGVLSSAEVFESAPEAAVAGGNLGYQRVRQPSAVHVLVLSNLGAQTLSVLGASLGGPNASDFAITADACKGARLAFRQSCALSVRFTPSAAGLRSATIGLSDNEPTSTTIILTGAGTLAPPKLTQLRLTPARFKAARSGSSAVAKGKAGTRLSFSLDKHATVTFTVERSQSGRLINGSCRAQTHANRTAKRCTRWILVKGSFTWPAKAGGNSLRFTGRIAGHKLPPASYRLVARPRDRSGTTGQIIRVAFTIRR